MRWLNYNHLFYFWTVAKEGSVAAASRALSLAPSTISAQISRLEEVSGQQLFRREGKQLVLTEMGHQVYAKATELFTVGESLEELLSGRRPAQRLVVGVAMVVPKLVVHHLLPAERLREDGLHLICVEDRPLKLMASLAIGEVDVIISDAPAPTRSRVSSYNHHLGDSGISLFASPDVASGLTGEGAEGLEDVPMLFPTEHATLRRQLEHYFKTNSLVPNVVAEFQDSALMKVAGQHGGGVFPAPSIIADEICEQYRVVRIADIPIRERFYAITTERRIRDAAAARIVETARGWFATMD